VEDRTWDALVSATKRAHTEMMADGLVMIPGLFVLAERRLVGHVRLRPVQRGADAANAIAQMSTLASAATATEVVAVWETQDIAVACALRPLYPDPALNLAWATRGRHVVYRFPYQEKQLPGRTEHGAYRVAPKWLPAPPSAPDAPLEPAIEGLLEYCWESFPSDDPDLLTHAANYLREQGYETNLFVD
jgi:hypothetical protein